MESNELNDLLIQLLDIDDEDIVIIGNYLKKISIKSLFENFDSIPLKNESYTKIKALKDIMLLIVEDI